MDICTDLRGWVENLWVIYCPNLDVKVDECLVPFKGCFPFKYYMPSKLCKYGIKMWGICDARTSYTWNMQVYTGDTDDGTPQKKQVKRVVLNMAAGLEGAQHHGIISLLCIPLAGAITENADMVGTVSWNKRKLLHY